MKTLAHDDVARILGDTPRNVFLQVATERVYHEIRVHAVLRAASDQIAKARLAMLVDYLDTRDLIILMPSWLMPEHHSMTEPVGTFMGLQVFLSPYVPTVIIGRAVQL